jgi:hypothetical protein
MPKIICKVCDGTKDANHDLPSNEYVHYPCTACKEGIKNFCKACAGQGEYWVYGGFGDNAHLHWCQNCHGKGFTPDSIEIEEDCRCTKPREKSEMELQFPEFFEPLGIEKAGECIYCNGTKKVMVQYEEGTSEYEKAKIKSSNTEERNK